MQRLGSAWAQDTFLPTGQEYFKDRGILFYLNDQASWGVTQKLYTSSSHKISVWQLKSLTTMPSSQQQGASRSHSFSSSGLVYPRSCSRLSSLRATSLVVMPLSELADGTLHWPVAALSRAHSFVSQWTSTSSRRYMTSLTLHPAERPPAP